jgi:DNA-directed RNA polymerase specialized sigma24 family protein
MVRALKKKTKSGKLYVHPPEIKAAIKIALTQDLATLAQRAAVRNPKDPQYLHSEVLVHVIRHAIRTGAANTYNTLLNVLFRRCMINLYTKVDGKQNFDANSAREEILGRLGELFADDGKTADRNDLDFYEIRFNRAFSKLRIDVVREHMAQAHREEPLPEIEESLESEFAPALLAKLSLASSSSTDPETHAEISELCRAMDSLPPEEREAVVLHHAYGYAVESTNPAETTVAKRCKVSGRTVRSRLAAAMVRLRRLKETPQ